MKMIPLFVFAAASLALLSPVIEGKNTFCYFTSWTTYRPGEGKFDVSNIDPSLCTHISYAFVGLSKDYTVEILDAYEAGDDGLKEFQHLVDLKKVNPDLKILVSLGGWNEGSEKFSDLAIDPVKRHVFAKDVLSFIQKYGFDGFDLDWEYPGLREGADIKHDAADFVALLQDLKDALSPHGYILSAAVAGEVPNIDIAYDIPAVSEILDIINVMTYDYHGDFDSVVGHAAPLYPSHLDPDNMKDFNVAAGIQHWLDKGADPAKIHLGVITYGRTFTLEDPSHDQLYDPAVSGGDAGPYTVQQGLLGYNEICKSLSDWPYVWDDEQQVPHKVYGDQWVGYDDEHSIKLKVEYANSKDLGGISVWSLDTDDFRGLCGKENYPLLRTIKATLQ